jgi:hypothetical protein
MEKIVGALLLVIAGLGYWLYQEVTEPAPPILPPLVFQETIESSDLIKAERKTSKVYALCKNKFWTLIPNYVMAWTSTARYTMDVSKVKISTEETEDGIKVILEAPPLKILDENSKNLIDENDFYTFKNNALVAKSEKQWEEHVKSEKVRAQEIALYYARYDLENDESLKKQIKESLARDILSLAAGTKSSSKISEIVVNIPPYQLEGNPPESPSLCEEQPFSSTIGLGSIDKNSQQ